MVLRKNNNSRSRENTLLRRWQRQTAFQLFRDPAISRHAHQPEAVPHDDDVIVADVIIVEIVDVKQSAGERDGPAVPCRPSFGDVDRSGGDGGSQHGFVSRRGPHLLPVESHGSRGRGRRWRTLTACQRPRCRVEDFDVLLTWLQWRRVERERVWRHVERTCCDVITTTCQRTTACLSTRVTVFSQFSKTLL